MENLSRRSMIGMLGALGAMGTAAAIPLAAAPPARADARPGGIPFFGPHQAGIAEPPQAHLQFAALRVDVENVAALRALLGEWTAAAESMTRGRPVGPAIPAPEVVPTDTGEALDLPAAALSVTFGFGPTLFTDAAGRDRFGIAHRQPRAFGALPPFRGDALDPRRIGGDLCVQACADDQQIAMHAVRNLLRIAGDRVQPMWSQAGFNRAAALAPVRTTPRNLFGFRDGTNNIDPRDADAMSRFVWAQPGDGSDWLIGGSMLAVRRIRMLTQPWDGESLEEQEATFGRHKADGAPLSGGSERTAPDFGRAGRDGKPLIPADSHMALAHPSANAGARILRRAFNYADPDMADGTPDVGLFFMSYQRSLVEQYIPM